MSNPAPEQYLSAAAAWRLRMLGWTRAFPKWIIIISSSGNRVIYANSDPGGNWEDVIDVQEGAAWLVANGYFLFSTALSGRIVVAQVSALSQLQIMGVYNNIDEALVADASWVPFDFPTGLGGPPTGPAGGQLGGTYPDPTVPGLATKAPISHLHIEADITGLVADLAALLTAVNAKADLIVGKVPTTELGGLGADPTKYLRGDQTWAVPPSSSNALSLSQKVIAADFTVPVDQCAVVSGRLKVNSGIHFKVASGGTLQIT